MNRLVVISNRVSAGGSNKGSIGGLAVGVQAAMKKAGGLWLGWNGKIEALPTQPLAETHGNIQYVTIGLNQLDFNDYYEGYSNSVLWPVFHQRPDLMRYNAKSYSGYQSVNRQFAHALLPYLKDDDIIWIHDYHLIPLGHMLREMGVKQPIGFFLHTPFPSYDILRTIPTHQALLDGLLAYDLVGFQTETDCRNFNESMVFGMQGSIGSNGRIFCSANRSTVAKVYPIGIETGSIPMLAEKGRQDKEFRRVRDNVRRRKLIIGVDRLDYSKGLIERFKAYESLLAKFPHLHRKIVYLQIAPVSRGSIKAYGELAEELDKIAGHIMATYDDVDWTPLHYINRSYRRATVQALYGLADVGLVTPLRDGMNLVAKEYVAAQDPENPGVLVLSTMAGASDELNAALAVNPYDPEEMARVLARALDMDINERKERWEVMMQKISKNDVNQWSLNFIHDLQKCIEPVLRLEHSHPSLEVSVVQ